MSTEWVFVLALLLVLVVWLIGLRVLPNPPVPLLHFPFPEPLSVEEMDSLNYARWKDYCLRFGVKPEDDEPKIEVGSLWYWPEPERAKSFFSLEWHSWFSSAKFVEVVRIEEWNGAVVFVEAARYGKFLQCGDEIIYSPYSQDEEFMLPQEFLDKYVPVV